MENNNVKDWWAKNPMTYSSTHGDNEYDGKKIEPGTKEFYDRLDKEFYSWNTPLHNEKKFDNIFPYDEYKGKKVLEIGCGQATMASNWAGNGAIITAVDLNPTSVELAKRRFDLYGLEGEILQADGNKLEFDDNTFDYVYSWGVLHHSPNLDKSMSELFRVLKVNGKYGIMLYSRESIREKYIVNYIEGFLHNESKYLNSLELNSRYGDGEREEGNPHTWPVTKNEMFDLFSNYSNDMKIKTLGTDLDSIFKFLLPGIGLFLPKFVKKVWARRFGWSLWMYGSKK